MGALWIDVATTSAEACLPAGKPGAYNVVPDPREPGEPGGGENVPQVQPYFYVWAMGAPNSLGSGGYSAVPDPGREPGDPGGGNAPTWSRLYAWNGVAWTVALELPDAAGSTVFGTGTLDVYATAVTQDRLIRMYHYNGNIWREQPLPLTAPADAGAIVGAAGDVFYRAGERVLRNTGSGWSVVFTSPALARGGSMVYVSPTEVYAIGSGSHARWNGSAWREEPAPELGIVTHAWGERDAGGALQMVAVGTDDFSGRVRLWKFSEDPTGTIIGGWGSPEGMPVSDTDPEEPWYGPHIRGTALAVHGTSLGRVAAVGVCGDRDCCRLYLLSGGAWGTVFPHDTYPPANDIDAAGGGDLWLALANGQLMHAVPPPEAQSIVDTKPPEPQAGISIGGDRVALRATPRDGSVVELEVSLPAAAAAKLDAFDVTGRRVATIDQGFWAAGTHRAQWITRGYPQGLYFCRLTAGAVSVTKSVRVHR